MRVCIMLPNFIWTGHSATDLWRHIDFPWWHPQTRRRNYSSGFLFGDVLHLRRSQIIRILTLAKISQSTAEILLLPFSKIKQPPCWNSTSGFYFDVFVVMIMRFSTGLPNFVQIRSSSAQLWRHGDFQDGGRQPCCIFRVVIDNPRRSIDGLNFVLKFWLHRIYTFGDSALFVFCRFR